MLAAAALVLATAAPAAAEPAPVVLPASPVAIAVGDIDADGTDELVVLLVWPEWSSATVNRSPDPTTYEIDVVPAIADRRELRAFEIAGLRAVPAAPPLVVGREVLSIGPARAVRPPFALTDDGLSALALETAADGTRALRLVPRVSVAHALRGAERPVTSERFLRRDVLVLPTAAGFAFVDPAGRVRSVPASFHDANSGGWGGLQVVLPRLVDLESDGTLDVLEVSAPDAAVALRRGLADGSFGPPARWDLTTLPERELALDADVAFADVLVGSGTLDAVVCEQQARFEGMGGGMDALRGVGKRCGLHRLQPGGGVAAEPHALFDVQGHAFEFDHPEGWSSAFRDLDADGEPELLAFTVRFGWFGAARALATKTIKTGIVPRVYRRARGSWSEVEDAAPRLDFSVRLDGFDLSRFIRLPGDVDGDGLTDLVQVAGREVEVYPGQPGGRVARRAGRTVRLQDRVRDVFGAVFTDLDGDGALDLIAFEELPGRDDDDPARPVRMELRRLRGGS